MTALADLILLQAIATWFMTGVIWFVQIVHYPLMARVGRPEWLSYERSHQRLTSYVVAPAMLIEVVSAAVVLVLAHGGDGNADSLSRLQTIAAWLSAGLLVVIWGSTFALQVPLHEKLSREFDTPSHRRLVRTNWLRTGAWSARAVLVTTLIL